MTTLHQSSGRWRLGLGLSLLAVLLWGVLPIALKVVLQQLDVYTLTWFRFVCAFGILAAYLAARQKLPTVRQIRAASWKLLAIATVFLGINYLCFLQGLALTSANNAEVLIQLAPVLFGLGAIAIFKERYTLRQWAGMAVLTLGLTLFFHEQLRSLITATSQYLLGSSILVIGALAWAIYALAQKQLLQKLPSASIMLLIYGGCALIFAPFATPAKILTLSPLHLGMLIFCGLNTLIAYGAFAEALQHWEASRISAVTALTPLCTLIAVDLVATLIPSLIAPEPLTLLGIVGAILVVGGCMAIALGKYRSSERV
jgi:drug/metabolite transporter (DMT)-like permease